MTTADFLAKTTGATPRQLVLIGALAVVLVGVLAYEFLLPTGTSIEPVTLTPRRSVRSAMATTPATVARPALAPEWPQVPVEKVVSHNPFRLDPRWLAPPVSEVPASDTTDAAPAPIPPVAVAPVVSPVLQERVTWVLLQEGQEMAGLGERTVRVGDAIDGYSVAAITPEGIVLVPAGQ